MAALTQNLARHIAGGDFRRIPLAANAAPFQGSLLGFSSGLARPLVAGDKFAGICRTKPDQVSSVAGAIRAETITGRFTVRVAAITGIATGLAAIGTKVYAGNDNDLTNASTGNTLIGSVSDYDAATGYEVECLTSHIRDGI